MAMKREDYAELGRLDAQRAHAGEPVLHMPSGSKTTWQTKAYDDAYVDEINRLDDADMLAQEQPEEPAKVTHGGRGGGKARGVIQLTGRAWFGNGIDPARMPANTARWPAPAAHHAQILANEIQTEKSLSRRERLYRALGRMQKRYQHKAQA